MDKSEAVYKALIFFAPICAVAWFGYHHYAEGRRELVADRFETPAVLYGATEQAPHFGDGYHRVDDYLLTGADFQCFGVTSENTPTDDSVLAVMLREFPSSIQSWILSDYLVVKPDGSYEVRKPISRIKKAKTGETYCSLAWKK